jgi:hypothetical protein
MNEIKIKKSNFSPNWTNVTREEALEFIKLLYYSITTGKNDEDRLAIAQRRLIGYSFTLDEIKLKPIKNEQKKTSNTIETLVVEINKQPATQSNNKTKSSVFTNKEAYSMQVLAREQMKLKLYTDLLMDLQICKIENWKLDEYIIDLYYMIKSIKLSFTKKKSLKEIQTKPLF